MKDETAASLKSHDDRESGRSKKRRGREEVYASPYHHRDMATECATMGSSLVTTTEGAT